jgi:nickel-dependent lactate racemase
VVQNDAKQTVAIGAGAPEAAFGDLVATARRIYEVPVPRAFDVAVAGVGDPKDVNIYQACRAASYLFFAPRSLVRDGGVIIIPAPTPEGAGQGVGEKRFLATMAGAAKMGALLADLRASGYPPGAQRAFVMAKVLEKVRVIIAGTRTPDQVRRCHMIPAADMAQAFALAASLIGRKNLDVAIVPRALLTLPIVGGGNAPGGHRV